MVVLYILAFMVFVVALIFVRGAIARSRIITKYNLTRNQMRAAHLIANFIDQQTGARAGGRTEGVASLVGALPRDWADAVANGFISPAQAYVTLLSDAPSDAESKPNTHDFSLDEAIAFESLNNTWCRLLRGRMPPHLQATIRLYVKGINPQTAESISKDWELARAELCRWAEVVVDPGITVGEKLSIVLRRADLEPTLKHPSDFDLTYSHRQEVGECWIRAAREPIRS